MSPMPADPLVGLRALRNDVAEMLGILTCRPDLDWRIKAHEWVREIDALVASLDAVTRAREGQDEPEQAQR
jgi:hypothetical protein